MNVESNIGSTRQAARFVVLDTGKKNISAVHEEWQLEAGVSQSVGNHKEISLEKNPF